MDASHSPQTAAGEVVPRAASMNLRDARRSRQGLVRPARGIARPLVAAYRETAMAAGL